MASQVDRKLTASAGEHYVCSMLARYLWAASLTRRWAEERTDVLAVHSLSRVMIEVQVKTTTSSSWPLGRKGTLPARSEREWYVLVKLGPPPGLPDTYVVPRDHVAAATWIGHRAWLTNPDVEPGKRNAPVDRARIGEEVWADYRAGWDLLQTDTRLVQVLLPGWMRSAMDLNRIGLPPSIPGGSGTRFRTGPTPQPPISVRVFISQRSIGVEGEQGVSRK